VSFQSPTSVPPQLAASAVSAHEQEHVTHNALKAEQEGMKATSTVQIHTATCPECGKVYVSGGTTITTFSPKQPVPGYSGKEQEPTGTVVNMRV
jgi:hypothetical protein